MGVSAKQLALAEPRIWGYCECCLTHQGRRFTKLIDGACAPCNSAEKVYLSQFPSQPLSTREGWFVNSGTSLAALEDAIEALPPEDGRRALLFRRALALLRVARL